MHGSNMTAIKRLRPIRERIPGLASGYDAVFTTLIDGLRKGLEADKAEDIREAELAAEAEARAFEEGG